MDWLGVMTSVAGWYLMPKRREYAMVVFLFGNASWITWAVMMNVWSILALQVIFVVLNVRTLYLWRHP